MRGVVMTDSVLVLGFPSARDMLGELVSQGSLAGQGQKMISQSRSIWTMPVDMVSCGGKRC